METIQLLTVEEAARLLKLTPYTIRRLLNKGKLPGRKIGGGRQWRIIREDLPPQGSQEQFLAPELPQEEEIIDGIQLPNQNLSRKFMAAGGGALIAAMLSGDISDTSPVNAATISDQDHRSWAYPDLVESESNRMLACAWCACSKASGLW